MRTSPAFATVARLADQGHLVGGSWTGGDSAGTYPHRYAATGETLAKVGLAGAPEVDAAVAAAADARSAWARTDPGERAAVLFRLADLLDLHRDEADELAALDNGTPIGTIHPGQYTAAWVRYYAGWADKLDGDVLPGGGTVRREPYGVVAVIPPWNGSMMGMGQKCGPALAAGNTVVAKPPEIGPFGSLRFAELAIEAGLPDGVLNVVVGGAQAGQALAGHAGIAKLSFTGGTVTARKIMAAAAAHITPVTLELGGKSPNIVFADADLDVAAHHAALFGTALLSGQGCALPTRLYAHRDIYDVLVDKVVSVLAGLAVGDPLDAATVVGPVATETAMERILAVIGRAVGAGAELLLGGRRLGGELADGWFVAPTVLGDVDHDSEVARNEVFGPVLSVLRFSDEDEVLAAANDSAFGLAAFVHTSDTGRADRCIAALAAGTVSVNAAPAMSPATPFGGWKQSGFGREGGRAGIEEMVQTKTVFR